MSSKPATNKREDKEKTAASEKILTRNKSNQIKRRLRNTDKSRKRIIQMTKLLRSPSVEKDPPVFNKKTKLKEKDKVLKKENTEKDSKKVTESASPKKKNNSKREESFSETATAPELFLIKKESTYLVKRANDEEFLPEKVKRRRRRKKMVLKPASGIRIASNKRKMTIPQKDTTSSPQPIKRARVSSSLADSRSTENQGQQQSVESTENQHQQQSFEQNNHPGSPSSDALELESLTDEDLLEILTCESPVWWEEAGDRYGDEYCEGELESGVDGCLYPDSISLAAPDPEETSAEVHKVDVKGDTEVVCDKVNNSDDKVETEVKDRDKVNDTTSKPTGFKEISQNKTLDKKFLTKRSKLENLLGNIKNKLSKHEDSEKIINNDNDTIINAHNADNDAVLNLADDKSNQVKIMKEGNNSDKALDNKLETKANQSEKKDKSMSESSESDDIILHLPYDERLNDFENIEIPVENNKKQCEETIVIEDDTPQVDEAIVIDNSDDLISPDEEIKEIVDDDVTEEAAMCKETDITKSPCELPKLTITSIQESSSPISVKSSIMSDTTDAISVSNVDNLDTISDTNIKFVDEEDSSGRNSVVDETFAAIAEKTPEIKEHMDESTKGLKGSIDESLDSVGEIVKKVKDIIKSKEEVQENIDEINRKVQEIQKKAKDNIDKSKKEVLENRDEINRKVQEIQKSSRNIDETKTKIIATFDDKTTKVNEEIEEESKKASVDRTTTMFRLKQAYKELCYKKDNAHEDKRENTGEKCKNIKQIYAAPSKGIKNTINVSPKDNILVIKHHDPRSLLKVAEPDTSVTVQSFKDALNSEETKIIINQKPKPDQNDGEKTKINSFYKKCKNSNQRRSRYTIVSVGPCKPIANVTETLGDTTKVTNDDVKTDVIISNERDKRNPNNDEEKVNSCVSEKDKTASIIVSDGTVKYCKKCSSIFDTDNCGYCLRKSVGNHNNIIDNSNRTM